MKKSILIFISIITLQGGYVTGQVPNPIIIGRDTFSLMSPLPLKFHPDQHPEAKSLPERKDHIGSSSCIWSYHAIWQLENGRIYLTAIWPPSATEIDSPADLSAMFRTRCQNGKVFADWINGKMGIMLGNYNYPFGAEQIWFFTVKNGIVQSDKIYRNYTSLPGRINIIPANKIAEQLEILLNENVDWSKMEQSCIPRDYYTDDLHIKIDKRGRCSVDLDEMLYPELYGTEFNRILKKERWDMLSYRGKKQKYILKFSVKVDYQNQRISINPFIYDQGRPYLEVLRRPRRTR